MRLKKLMLKVGFICLFFYSIAYAISYTNSDRYEILIKNTNIVDGTGRETFKGDIAIEGEKIVAVGKVKGNGAVVIDGSGLVTCPGFIDSHSHADMTIMEYPLAENLVMQGITTFLGGNCGTSPAPQKELTFGQWLTKVEELGISINYAPLVGCDPIRLLVMGEDYRRTATLVEIEEMKKVIEESMRSGAFGFSIMRDPSPGAFADIKEIIELAKVVQKYSGLYAPHTKHIQWQWFTDDPELVAYDLYYGPPEDVWVGLYRGYMEAIEISRIANIPLHIVHLANAYRIPQPHPDYLEEAAARATLEIINNAKKEGLDVTFDVIASAEGYQRAEYLLDAFYTTRVGGLHWVQKIDKKEFLERLNTSEFRERIRRVHDSGRLKFGMVHTKSDPYWYNCFRILSCKNKDYEGKTIGEIADSKETDYLETIFNILVEDPETIWVNFVDKRDTDIINAVFLKHPSAMASTDVRALPFTKLEGPWMPGPPAYSLYPHYIGHYIRELGICSLVEGIKKATYSPAKMLGLNDRGILKPGAYADIVIFDFKNIRQTGDFLNPIQRPEGIKYVLVNGTVVYKDNAHTGEKPGYVLRKK